MHVKPLVSISLVCLQKPTPSVIVVDDFGYHYTAFHVKSSQLY